MRFPPRVSCSRVLNIPGSFFVLGRDALEIGQGGFFFLFNAKAHLVRSSSWRSKDLLFLTASP